MNSNKNRIINIISNKNYKSKKTSRLLSEKLKDKGFIVANNYNNNAELNICVGGDGAFLRAVHRNRFPKIPFVGINTGNLGFFQEILPENIDEFIESYMRKEYYMEEIFLIQGKIKTRSKTFFITGINEIVIKHMKSKVIHLEIFLDGNHLERFSGDGVIISTPVGSTAYNFSSGGSIVHPSLRTLQLTPLSPISSKAFRSLPNSAVVPGDMTISIKPEFRYTNSTLVINDGMDLKYNNIQSIDLNMSDKILYRLNFHKDMYWKNLKSKFL